MLTSPGFFFKEANLFVPLLSVSGKKEKGAEKKKTMADVLV